jgi:hypothetical protein
MSDITISRPEVVTGHTDVICSTSIQRDFSSSEFNCNKEITHSLVSLPRMH